jgi:hypothetical protein
MQASALINQAIPGLQRGSKEHTDALRAATMLAKLHGNQGAPGAGVQATQLGDLLKNVMKNAMLQRIMQQQGQGKGPGSGQGAGPEAQPPMPSTPLPGA